MTMFTRKSFSVSLGGSDAFREGYDRAFGKKETPRSGSLPPTQDTSSASSVRDVLVKEEDLRVLLDALEDMTSEEHYTEKEMAAMGRIRSAIQSTYPVGF